MTEQNKKEIQFLIEEHVKQFDSQAQACRSIKDVSEATIIQMVKGRWENISDEMWRTVAKQVGFNSLNIVETFAFQTCILYFDLAKEKGETVVLTGASGLGKTIAGTAYQKSMKTRNVYYMRCANYLNRKYFLWEMIEAMGRTPTGMNIYEMMKFIITELRKQDKPLFIFDEIDKLTDPVLLFFITLYNDLHKLCGFVTTSTDAITRRMNKNLRKIGYSELDTRFSKNVPLPNLSRQEVRLLCLARGIQSEEEISRAWNESDGSNIRRIDRLYLKHEMEKKEKNRLKPA